MIMLLGDVHHDLAAMRDVIEQCPPQVQTIVQVGDLWVWPDSDDVPPNADGTPRGRPPYPDHRGLHWRQPQRDISAIDGNHFPYWLSRGLTRPTPIAAGLLYLPRGTVAVLQGRNGPLRVGFLGGADSLMDAAWRQKGVDWWPEEESVKAQDVDQLLANAQSLGGLDLLITHTPPATITAAMTRGEAPHPSAVMVEEAWRALGGGVADAPVELIAGHMHMPFRDEVLRVEVLDYLGVTFR